MNGKLGALKRVDLRNLWLDEAADFTPWLAQEANIAKLSEAVGLELEVEHTEVACGPYSADILARDSGTGDPVVIENQLGKTDHDHIGKAITYAAALNASTIIWVARDFTDEHRRAIDWLNENGSDNVAFFGVRVELWQIDESLPAVQFNVVARPVEIAKAAIAAATGELSDSRKLQLEWWTAFRQALLEARAVPSAHTPAPRYWYNVALGRAGLHLSNIASPSERKMGVRVYLRTNRGGQSAYAQLLASKAEIEKEIGQPLEWNPNPESRNKMIALYRQADLERRDRWPEYLAWMVDMTRRFRNAFAPRLKHLVLTHEDDESAEEAEV